MRPECKKSGCRIKVKAQGYYCGLHQARIGKRKTTKAVKRTQRGNSEFERNARAVRVDMIEEHGYLFCQHCGRSDRGLDTHHLIFRSEKPGHEYLHDKRNLSLLCMDGCHPLFHEEKSIRQEMVIDRGLVELFGEDILRYGPAPEK